MMQAILETAPAPWYPLEAVGPLQERMCDDWATLGFTAERIFECWTPWMG